MLTRYGRTRASRIEYSGQLAVLLHARDASEHKLIEEQLRASQKQLRAHSARLQFALAKERKRIAREIHDELGRDLTALKLDLAWFGRQLATPGKMMAPPVLNKIKSMAKSIDATIKSVRKITSELRPEVLDTFGLKAAVECEAKQFQARTGIRCRLALDEGDVTLDPERATAIYRIVQEVLTNVTRHAQATRLAISLNANRDELLLEIRDNGKGITPRQMAAAHSFGLLGMRERALAISGELQISGMRGKGTTVTLTVPRAAPFAATEP